MAVLSPGGIWHLTESENTWVASHAIHDQSGASPRYVIWSDGVSACAAIRLYNKTGSASVKGYLASLSSSYDDSYVHTPVNSADPVGVVLESGIADGAPTWIGTNGLAEVYINGSTTRGDFVRASATADSVSAGIAISEAVPSPPLSIDNHWREVGHASRARGSTGLVLCVIHFN